MAPPQTGRVGNREFVEVQEQPGAQMTVSHLSSAPKAAEQTREWISEGAVQSMQVFL